MDRFKEVLSYQIVIGINIFKVVQDTITGVLYAFVVDFSKRGVSLTPLLNVDGKPIIDK